MRTLHKILRWFAWDFWLSLVQPLIFRHLDQCRRINSTLKKKKYQNT